MNEPMLPPSLLALLADLSDEGDGLPDADSDLGRTTREFFANNWNEARRGLLARTDRVRVHPLPGPGPTSFSFEFDLPYRSRRPDGTVELAPGPIRGTIVYRSDLLLPDPHRTSLMVFLDRTPGFFHPNYNRRQGRLCVGGVPDGPFSLEALIAHLYGIVSYQNRESRDPFDLEAVHYFSTDASALEGADEVPPLY